MARKKHTIDDFKDRMSCPINAVRTDPRTRKPITGTKTKTTKKRGK